MRKLSIFMLWSLCTIFTSNAQEFNFGVKGGVNLASVGGNTYAGLGGLGSKLSFHVGGVVEIPISEKLAAQPELLYSSQGTKWNLGSNGNNLKLDYLNLPILGKYYILEGLSAEAGPLVGFLVSTNEEDEDRFKKLDVAFAIGASYKLNDQLFFSLRYNKGILNINGADFDGSSQNNVFQIAAGYAF
ncbi:PorT family protein [Aggregatimonas sangjinii]|uniref:PorT family protein n=1 Tax=Aggregatimonas sangjinii TaxID=2583587 RepID=A0A5B7SX60_9FLAO|nr:porin family protein [Aggregatimonas sangjinii]QCX01561.1 PorT family protein [Aggregatimonas sangjinii]